MPGLIESLLIEADRALRVLAAPAHTTRAPKLPPAAAMDADQRKHVAGLMRINHTGEVCAQALYFGHAAASHSEPIKTQMLHAADEEGAHLAWCELRLTELKARPSLLNPVWYGGAFALGWLSARFSDQYALGFVEETERQVEAHLSEHLSRLPEQDTRSAAILSQMRAEEAAHGAAARAAGARKLPWPVPGLMRRGADLMRALAYRV